MTSSATHPDPAGLPQADASSLVDRAQLEAKVQEMYRLVAREEDAELHFAVGRPLALRLGYPRELLNVIPPEALASFAGVGYHLDLAALQPGERVLDLGSGSGTDVFARPCSSARAAPLSASTSPTSRSARRDGCETATGSRRPTSSRPGSTLFRSRTGASTPSSRTV